MPAGPAEAAPAPGRSRDRLVRETWRTWANLVTAIRVAAALACFVTAAASGSAAWNFAGLGVYWVLDVADGVVARRLRQETRIGAQLDILCDRVLIASFYANYLGSHPGMAIPVALHLLQFMVLDQYLSQQYMRWPCISPNDFHEVDRTIWTWNWSPPAKVANGALVTGAIVVAGWQRWSWIVPALVSSCVVVVKVWSMVRLAGLPAPETWLAGRSAR